MTHYDVCHGDADGLFALRQWRLATPAESIVVTGIKRETALLARVPAAPGDHVTVFDLAVEPNRAALKRLLAAAVNVVWYDHHDPGELPKHARLHAHIDTDPETCTSILVDARCKGRFRAWAVAATYGDNLPLAAERLADTLALNPAQRAELRRLGEAVNYNAYGDSAADVRIQPAALYRWLSHTADAFEAARLPIVDELDALRRDDLGHARSVAPLHTDERCMAVVLPDAPWSRRVLGPYANELALQHPGRAHAVLKTMADGGYAVSVRSPQATLRGAADLAREFGGGGRAAAAGIDRLPPADLPRFLAQLAAARWS